MKIKKTLGERRVVWCCNDTEFFGTWYPVSGIGCSPNCRCALIFPFREFKGRTEAKATKWNAAWVFNQTPLNE